MFNKILIANRGEIALRILRTIKEMGIKTVAVYSTADVNSLHVKFADEAVCIGTSSSFNSYLNIQNLISAAEITNSDAIHPGYGFLAENAYFSSMCNRNKIKFIGPKSEHIEIMGNKFLAKQKMINAGLECIPGSNNLISSYDEADKISSKIGYPVIIKSNNGGGGKGIRVVWEKKELKYLWNLAIQESKISFGQGSMYIEKLIPNTRHIEIQIAGDIYGTICHMYERDCSIQRRYQKLVEETPSPFLNNKLRSKITDAAVKAIKCIGYEGLGTMEFLVDQYNKFYFMEMNTRLQVEHAITEETIGYDLIREQILLAVGEKISNKKYYTNNMHSIECRINAEDPAKNFRPTSGIINQIHIPGGHGVRVDTHVYSGYFISPYYDSMIAKLITTSIKRDLAIAKMRRSLDEFIIEGISTTIPFHKQLMNDENFINGIYTTNFIENFIFNPDFCNEL